jgi:hypothetical protein
MDRPFPEVLRRSRCKAVHARLFCAVVVTAGAIGCATSTDTSSISAPDVHLTQAAATTGAVAIQPEVLAGGYHVKAIGVTGDAVGDATNPVSCNAGPLPTLWHPDGSRVTLPTGTTYCGGSPQAINASGVILGSLSGGPANSQGMWFPSGGSYVLQVVPPTPDGTRPITAGALNDNNEILGWSTSATKLWWWSSATGWLSVQVPANTTLCQSLNGINNRGEFVARCNVGGVGNGYYWSSHNAAPLLLPRPAGTGDVAPRSINDAGVIVGNGPGGGLRWQPSPSGYVLDVFPGALYTIASDGTMAGSILLTKKSNSRSPVIFYSPSSYQILGLTSSGTWGEAVAIAVTPTGRVLGGTEGNVKALRWRVP